MPGYGVPMTSVTSTRPNLMASLEDEGHRLTTPRRVVARAIERQPEAFTAEEVCEAAPGVGRATVYRTIKLLVDTGALCKLAMPDGAPKYSAARAEHHHHTVCTRCGRVGEYRASTIERVLRSLQKEISGEIVGHRMEVFINCDECLQSERS